MDDIEDAILTGHSLDVIKQIRQIEDPLDFRFLIRVALKVQDFSALWYIMELGSRIDTDLDSYLLKKCGQDGQTLPCTFLEYRNNPLSFLQEAVLNADEDSLYYAVDLLYAPLDPNSFDTYSSLEYQRAVDISNRINQQVEQIINQASPFFLDRIFSSLPSRLQVNLRMASG